MARSKAQERIDFNESYLAVLEGILSERYARRIKRQTYRARRALLPLERKATDAAVLNREKRDAALAAFEEAQRLPRLAVEQTSLRMREKAGEAAAAAYRADALSELDAKLARKRAALERRYPADDARKASAADVQRYEEATVRVDGQLAAYTERCRQRQAAAMEKQTRRIESQNARLREGLAAARARSGSADALEAAMEPDAVLKISDLLMQFGGLKAVDHLSFSVREGEIFGLIGPNGAGKTTVFNCITQFYKPTGGTVYYRDRSGDVIDLSQKKVHDVVKTGIMRTFQNVELIWELSVLDNMLIGAHSLYHANLFEQLLHTRKLRQEEAVMRARALGVLEKLGLLPYKDMIPLGLPYGILKKVELARTLMVNPRLIILDEPAAGLNEAETDELAATIRSIREELHCTIFLVEHDMSLVMDICDTVCAISFGKMLAIGTPEEIQNNPLVQEAYLGGE